MSRQCRLGKAAATAEATAAEESDGTDVHSQEADSDDMVLPRSCPMRLINQSAESETTPRLPGVACLAMAAGPFPVKPGSKK